MPRRSSRVNVWRDRRGRFVPPGALGVGAQPARVRVRRDPRTGQFTAPGKRPIRVPRHPRTGRFITRDEFQAIRRKRPPVTPVVIDIMRRRYPNLYQRYLQLSREKQRALLASFGRGIITTEPIRRR